MSQRSYYCLLKDASFPNTGSFVLTMANVSVCVYA